MQDNKKISRRYGNKDTCLTVFSSMTAAMKAQSLLASNGIRASVIKTGGSRSKSGCAFGVSCSCDENERAIGILELGGMIGDVVRPSK